MINLKCAIKQSCILLLSIVIIFATWTGTWVKADEDIAKELKKEIVPLKTVEPKDDLKDLMPLKEILKDKKIVGMGEATHGTSEFFKMKHRVFKFLVEEMGYRAFAIEANFGEGEIINDYISNGVGDENSALNAFKLWTWRVEEVKEMLNWMKSYNLKAKDGDKIRFYGFDMQYLADESSILLKYLKNTNPELEKKFLSSINCNVQILEKDILDQNKIGIIEVIKDFKLSKEELIKKSSLEQYEMMLKNLDIIEQCINYYSRFSSNSYTMPPAIFRDKSMAENVKWIVDREKSLGNNKMMLWAHNGHIGNNEIPGETSLKSTGKYLKDFYGDSYYALGFEFFKGNFIAKDTVDNCIKEFELTEGNNKTLGYTFNKLDTPIFYLDLKTALKNSSVENWFKNRDTFINGVGLSFNEKEKDKYIRTMDVNKEFDGLIFINETTAAKKPVYNLNKKVDSSQNKDKPNKNSEVSTIAVISISISFLIIALIGAKVVKDKKNSK